MRTLDDVLDALADVVRCVSAGNTGIAAAAVEHCNELLAVLPAETVEAAFCRACRAYLAGRVPTPTKH
jgi:hypothetical protein